jgi:hypothetical protein
MRDLASLYFLIHHMVYFIPGYKLPHTKVQYLPADIEKPIPQIINFPIVQYIDLQLCVEHSGVCIYLLKVKK